MKYSKALHIIDDIDSGEFTDIEKLLAISMMIKEPLPPMSISKQKLFNALKYLFNENYEFEADDENNNNYIDIIDLKVACKNGSIKLSIEDNAIYAEDMISSEKVMISDVKEDLRNYFEETIFKMKELAIQMTKDREEGKLND